MTYEELTTPLTRAEVEANIYASLAAQDLDATRWKPGAVVRAIITGVSIVLAAFSVLIALIAKGGFLELATGDWLTVYARLVYKIERDPGSFAAGHVTLDNAGGGVFAGGPGDLVASTAAGQLYRNTASYSLGSLQTGVLVPVQAVDRGTAGSAGATEIVQLETTLIGVSVSNALALVGTDPETDDLLREQCRAYPGTITPNGPRDAYYFAARNAKRADGTRVGVTRVRTIADGAGGVRTVVANAGGPLTAPDLASVDAAIQARAVPPGITATTESAVALPVTPTYELWLQESEAIKNLTDAEVKVAIEGQLAAFLGAFDIGGVRLPGQPGRVYRSAISRTIAEAFPGFLDINLTVPATDVDVDTVEAPALGPVDATIHRVPAT